MKSRNNVTTEEKELIAYLKSIWLRMRLGIAVLVGCIALLWILCRVLVLIHN